jgi:UDP-galactopyranose mutase
MERALQFQTPEDRLRREGEVMTTEDTGLPACDLLCFSHLRWNFVFQRPQHLITRAARERRVFFFEEPVSTDGPPRLRLRQGEGGLITAVPELPRDLGEAAEIQIQRQMLDELLEAYDCRRYVTWHYTPMALRFTRHLKPVVAVYDCMDQLASFKGAPRAITILEQELFSRVDVAFTGGQSLFEAKRAMHRDVHAFPSSVDAAHFATARASLPEPHDQALLAKPRLGYAGVIDERLDLELVDAVATRRPGWQLILVGPVVKIDPATLPRRPNIHYLGGKSYDELPAYLASWDVAMMPFARNEATRYISPTKTPEYLAAGRRVVSTSIRDVVSPYGERALVAIADEPDAFVARVEEMLGTGEAADPGWLARVDAFLEGHSWDQTFTAMWRHVTKAAGARAAGGAITTVPQISRPTWRGAVGARG